MHSVVGTLILLTSLTSFFFVFKALDYRIHVQYHAIYGLITLSLGLMLSFGGIIAHSCRVCRNAENAWDKSVQVRRI